MTQASKARIETFVDWFIRSDYVANWAAEKDSDFINEPDRAERCYDAAKDGCDGKTHAEVIEDWREAFAAWIRDKRLWQEPNRFGSGENDGDKGMTLEELIHMSYQAGKKAKPPEGANGNGATK